MIAQGRFSFDSGFKSQTCSFFLSPRWSLRYLISSSLNTSTWNICSLNVCCTSAYQLAQGGKWLFCLYGMYRKDRDRDVFITYKVLTLLHNLELCGIRKRGYPIVLGTLLSPSRKKRQLCVTWPLSLHLQSKPVQVTQQHRLILTYLSSW